MELYRNIYPTVLFVIGLVVYGAVLGQVCCVVFFVFNAIFDSIEHKQILNNRNGFVVALIISVCWVVYIGILTSNILVNNETMRLVITLLALMVILLLLSFGKDVFEVIWMDKDVVKEKAVFVLGIILSFLGVALPVYSDVLSDNNTEKKVSLLFSVGALAALVLMSHYYVTVIWDCDKSKNCFGKEEIRNENK